MSTKYIGIMFIIITFKPNKRTMINSRIFYPKINLKINMMKDFSKTFFSSKIYFCFVEHKYDRGVQTKAIFFV